MPQGIWTWRGTAVLLALIASALEAVLLLRPESRSLAGAASASGLITYPVVLAAAVILYFHWRISGGRVAAWLTVSLTIAAAQGLVQAGLGLAQSERVALEVGWPIVAQLTLGVVLTIVALRAESLELRHDPLAVGLGLGVVMGLVFLTLSLQARPPAVSPLVVGVLNLSILVVGVLVACTALHLSTVPVWVRLRLALATVLLITGQLATNLADSTVWADGIGLVANALAATVTCALALALLRQSINQSATTLDDLHDRLEEVEAVVRVDRERLHEIGSTVAGITSASQLIREARGLSDQRRLLLEEMLEAELSRLGRLMVGREDQLTRDFSIDDIVRQLVVSQQSRGRVVRWSPSGHRASGRPDDLAEVVNILLENAARHGGPAGATVEVRQVDADVEIAVSDTGPGVAAEMRERLFDWGARAESSPGQGIGLHIARGLMLDQRGSLALVESSAPGATFVLRLPMAVITHDALSHVAL